MICLTVWVFSKREDISAQQNLFSLYTLNRK